MGAGSFLATASLAGSDNPSELARVVPTTPGAALYDPLTRTFPFDSVGAVRATHPVDQAMILAVTVAQNTIRSAVETGLARTRLKRATKANALNLVTDVVRNAAKRLTDAGDVLIEKIVVDQVRPGRIYWTVTYRNLRLEKPESTSLNGT